MNSGRELGPPSGRCPSLVCLASKSLQSMSGDKIRKVIVFNSHGQQELVPHITGINRLIISALEEGDLPC